MWASEQYRESWQPAGEWINNNAPDFVKECIDEMHAYIMYLRGHLDSRDNLIRDICTSNGIDPAQVLKPESEDTEDDNSGRNSSDPE